MCLCVPTCLPVPDSSTAGRAVRHIHTSARRPETSRCKNCLRAQSHVYVSYTPFYVEKIDRIFAQISARRKLEKLSTEFAKGWEKRKAEHPDGGNASKLDQQIEVIYFTEADAQRAEHEKLQTAFKKSVRNLNPESAEGAVLGMPELLHRILGTAERPPSPSLSDEQEGAATGFEPLDEIENEGDFDPEPVMEVLDGEHTKKALYPVNNAPVNNAPVNNVSQTITPVKTPGPASVSTPVITGASVASPGQAPAPPSTMLTPSVQVSSTLAGGSPVAPAVGGNSDDSSGGPPFLQRSQSVPGSDSGLAGRGQDGGGPISSPDWCDKDTVLAAVTADGLALQFASEALQADREVVLTAVAQNCKALEFARCACAFV